MFKYLGKTKVSCQELIKGYLPEYELECKRKAFERALEVYGHEDGDIEVSHPVQRCNEILNRVP